jgi:hypothetical protein
MGEAAQRSTTVGPSLANQAILAHGLENAAEKFSLFGIRNKQHFATEKVKENYS